MDSVSPEDRSRIMASIRGRDTEPERLLRSALHRLGFRFRIDARDLPGRPDLKLTRHGAVVFVHGCFWHGHDCGAFRLPSSNVPFWLAKIQANRARDLRAALALREAGWRVCVVWECALRGRRGEGRAERVAAAVARWVDGRGPFLELGGAPGAEVGAGGAAGATKQRRATYRKGTDMGAFAAERRAAYRGLPALGEEGRAR